MLGIGLLLSCLPIFAVGLLIITYAIRRFVMLKRLEKVGLTGVGKVLETKTATNVDGTAATVTVVRFKTQAGALKQSVVRTFANVRVGTQVPVIYDPAAPELAELLSLRPGISFASVACLGVSFLCVGAFMLGLVVGFIPMLPNA
jgi:hypothetical protein